MSRHLAVIDAVSATVPADAVAALRARPDVTAVLPDRLIQAPTPPATRSRGRVRTSGSSRSLASTGPVGLPEVDTTECPTDPAHPLLEPEALRIMRAASDQPTTPTAADYATGAGVRVGVVANAVDVHNPDLIRPDGTPVVSSYVDFAGTGTDTPAYAKEGIADVASIAAQGRTTLDLSALGYEPPGCTIRVQGTAPGADVVAIKALDGTSFYDSTAVESIDYAVTRAHVDVLNESFSDDGYPDSRHDPIALANAAAVAAGVTVVAASGDSGYDSAIGSPASARPGSDGVISVGASTQLESEKQFGFYPGTPRVYSGDMATLSTGGIAQSGRTVDVVAPGFLGWSLCTVGSPLFVDCPDFPGVDGLDAFQGTSESAPLTSGVAALVIQRYRATHHGQSPTPALVKQIITSTADDIGAPATEQGAGEVDALRAVRLAGALDRPTARQPTAGDVLVSPTQADLTATRNHPAHTRLTLTNPTAAGRNLVVARREPVVTHVSTQQITLTAGTYDDFPITVPNGTDRVTTDLVVPAAGASYLNETLYTPTGDVANDGASSDISDTMRLAADHPTPGTWRAEEYASDYSGPATLVTTSFRNRSTTMGRVHLAAHTRRALPLTVPAAPGGSQRAFALTLTDAATGVVATSVPIVERTVTPLGSGRAAFTGTLSGGNGRAGVLSGFTSYLLRVPAGRPAMRIAVHLGSSGQRVDGYLIAPSGNAVDQQSTLPPGDTNPADGGRELDLAAVQPTPGLWQVLLGVNGPLAAPQPELRLHGTVRTTPAPFHVTALPHGARLPAGTPHRVTVHVTNDTDVPHAYVLDPRLDTYSTIPLTGPDAVTITTANPLPVATVTVPAETTRITTTMTATQPLAATLSPDNYSFPGSVSDPEAYAVSSHGRLTLTLHATRLTDGPWLELPVAGGPFGATGLTGPLPVHLTTQAVTRAYDTDVTSQTGDPWTRPPADLHPVVVPPHTSADIAATITPPPDTRRRITGRLIVEDWDPVAGVAGELASLPYTYTEAP